MKADGRLRGQESDKEMAIKFEKFSVFYRINFFRGSYSLKELDFCVTRPTFSR
jgi:hypothetical protein